GLRIRRQPDKAPELEMLQRQHPMRGRLHSQIWTSCLPGTNTEIITMTSGCVCACVCVCVCERERERESVCTCVCVIILPLSRSTEFSCKHGGQSPLRNTLCHSMSLRMPFTLLY